MLRLKRTIKTKFMLSILVVAIISVAGTGFASQRLLTDVIRHNSEEQAEIHLKQLNRSLDQYMAELDQISLSIRIDKRVRDSILYKSQHGTTDIDRDQLEIIRQVHNLLFDLASFRTDITGIYVFNLIDHAHSYSSASRSLSVDYRIEEEPWFEKVKRNRNSSTLIVEKTNRHLLFDPGEPRISLLRTITEPDTLQVIGMIRIDQRISAFDKLIGELSFIQGSGLAIFSPDGELIYTTGEPGIAYAVHSDNAAYRTIEDVDYQVIRYESRDTGWLTSGWIPVAELTQDARKINQLIVYFIIIAAVIIFILSIYLSRKVTMPIQRLKNKMMQVSDGNFHVTIPVESSDEIGQLSRTFNKMTSLLHTHVEKVAELERASRIIELEKKEMEIQALYLQINPHFIYNTLESIILTAELNRDREAARMSAILGTMLRYSLNRESGVVTLQRELAHVQNYIRLQNVRYEDKFRLQYEIPSEWLSVEVMKFTLQPIVENAVIHGLISKQGTGWIRVYAEAASGLLMIHVRDDGKGISAAKLEQLKRYMADPTMESAFGLGMVNVYRRLKLVYGSGAGLLIDSEEGKGTQVSILLPLGRRGEPHEDYDRGR